MVVNPTKTVDRYGDEVNTYDAENAPLIRAYVQPNDSDENTNQRDAVLYTHKVFSNEPVQAHSRIVFEDRTYEVDGEAKRWDTPTGKHHYEFHMKVWEG